MYFVRPCSLTDMDVPLRVLLIITGLTGIHSITTVSKVSVKAGKSISIPCLYDSKYRKHVKYLCEGYSWRSCDYVINTNEHNSGRISISDDKIQRIFNMTVNNLRNEDTGDYWCAVEINDGPDIHEYFHLSVTSGTPNLYVDHQEITGSKGKDITINCYYRNRGKKSWCRLGSSCVTTGSSGLIDGTKVSVNAKDRNVFTVTMSGLRTESSGWYQCVKGDLQMPVHVTVTEPTVTEPSTTTTLATTSTTLSPTTESVNLTSVFADRTLTTVQDEQQSGSAKLKKFIIPLSVLVFTVMLTLFIWFMLKRHKQTKSASSAMTEAEEEVTYSKVEHIRNTSNQRTKAERDEDVTYSSVVNKRQQSGQRVEVNDDNVTYSNVEHIRNTSSQRTKAERDEDVTYSSVVNKRQQNGQRVEANEDNVTYSTLA
ncbi:uncharacterized protein LOC129092780 isoform X1 [Anoplopoma fimbria]|uniref:uncharacterized protein LOC129092780 isoform X1 n=1 Tax=Anoplopoma fimbria TaxID=229290 RepID=UPI0023ECFAD9|nr:uncharacterized protein LOC129092780 isoform X1 [Anoplopoma fimbria]XP_054456773.1 uncharacterized protein LOC129092780 isoform X1 [Anoplopoma fimbria]XP_054456775.1 uncharacterized protein LOC129092780 isoform X1 [Anoplopoma fimbria]XP_054456776.1 uncharacterized protein LOC129092780 isoform X1 [Anoplopoma fimbria]